MASVRKTKKAYLKDGVKVSGSFRRYMRDLKIALEREKYGR